MLGKINKKIYQAAQNSLDLTKENMEMGYFDQICYLDLSGQNLNELSGIEVFIDLISLNISHNPISDLKPLMQLLRLEELNIYNIGKVDIETLMALPNLQILTIYQHQIDDLHELKHLSFLKKLILDDSETVIGELELLNIIIPDVEVEVDMTL